MPHASFERNPQPVIKPEEYLLTPFAGSLRRDGKALTYVHRETGSLLLIPRSRESVDIRHDYDYTDRAAGIGLSSATVMHLDGKPAGLEYDADSDLITLPALFNASLSVKGAEGDIVASLVLVRNSLETSKRELGLIPNVGALDDIAIARSYGTAELLAPFETSQYLSPEEVMSRLAADATEKSPTIYCADVLQQCFNLAAQQFPGAAA